MVFSYFSVTIESLVFYVKTTPVSTYPIQVRDVLFVVWQPFGHVLEFDYSND